MQKAGMATAATGAVWAAPSVLGSSLAFAGASCIPPSATFMSFVSGAATPGSGTNNNGNGSGVNKTTPSSNNDWTFTAAGMTGSDKLGVFSGYGPAPDRFVVERNPGSTLGSAKVTYTHSLGTLTAGRTYTFSFNTYIRTVNQYDEVMAVKILKSPSTPVMTATYTTQTSGTFPTGYIPLGSDGTNTTWTMVYTVPTGGTGTYSFQYVFTFTNLTPVVPPLTANGVADDIGVTAPTVTCT